MGKSARTAHGKDVVKRILVDGTYLDLQMKGVGRYAANTLRHLAKLDTVNEYHILVRQNTPLPSLPQNARWYYIPVRLHNHYLHGGWTLPQYAKKLRADLAWIPYETTLGFLPCPYLVVCHDVPQLITRAQSAAGEHISLLRRLITGIDVWWLCQSLRHATVVFANSHFVGNWLRDGLGIPVERIRYAPCAPGADFAKLAQTTDRNAVRRKLDCPAGYILIFATGDQRENLDTSLRVFNALVTRGIELNLVIAGIRENDAPHIRARVNAFAWRERARLLPFYGEDQVMNLAEVYAGASVYLDLSLHEGFGMQVIEAMACGTPVVCSNRGALPEVVGEAALIVNPQDIDGIANAVLRLVSRPSLCRSMITRGTERATLFTWQQTAQTVLDYIRVMTNKV